ncbi:MAG: glycoside hydrolase family 99-like domain-containing protein, partial [Deltaproteobacteria bacterium]|nr:glycoside hydrolase family 99-like domain-containing protein [Deltaproteobacteria bacterium]
PFSAGETISTDQVNYHGEYIYGKGKKGKYRGKPLNVGMLPPNAWGLYLVFAGTGKLNDPKSFGFDGAVQFPPHSLQKKKVARVRPSFYNKKYSGRIFSYNEAAQDSISTMASGEYAFPGIFMNWDNEARKPGNSLIFHGGTPTRYKRWLEKIFEIVDQKKNRDEKLVFINAWNEWSEGTYLEPDRRFGYGYLQATADTIKKFSKKSRLG